MRTGQIVRKDVGDAVRSRRLYVLIITFALLCGLYAYLIDGNLDEGLVLLFAFLVPLVGLMFAHHSVVGKRESSELHVLLGLPFSRRDIIVGTFLGRSAVVTAGVASGYLATIVVATVVGTSFDLSALLTGFVFLSILGTAFVGIAVGVSAAVKTTTVASVGVFGVYLLFGFQLWRLVPDSILYLINGLSLPNDRPTWAAVFDQLSPFAGMRNAMAGIDPSLAEAVPVAAASVPNSPPTYMEPWFGLVVVLAWLAVPLGVGYLRFERGDL